MPKLDYNELLDHIKDLDQREYSDEFLDTSFNGKKESSCPICGSSDNLKYKPSNNLLHCFSDCGYNNIIDLTILKDGLEFIPAVKKIAANLNLDHTLDDSETTAETAEEIETRKRLQEARQKQREAKLQKEKEELEQLQQMKQLEMTKLAPTLSAELQEGDGFKYATDMAKIFPNQTPLFEEWKSLYVGYDTTHDTIVTINRDLDGTTYDINRRLKYKWDDEKKCWSNIRKQSYKWGNEYGATTRAFPYDYYEQKVAAGDNTVFLTEGHKDALNLLALDINVLTLGGVGNDWTEHKELLKDKTVYIWYDNDSAGYTGAIKRYLEIVDIAKEVYIVVFFQIDPLLKDGYDITDFLVDRNLKDKKEVLHTIAYFSSKLTTSLIQEIEDYIDKDLSKYYFNQATTDFPNILKAWEEQFNKDKDVRLTVKGEKDIQNLDEMLESFKTIRKTKDFKLITRDSIIDMMMELGQNVKLGDEKKKEKALELTTALELVIDNYEKIYKEYRQTHLVDMVLAFDKLTKKTGFTLAKYDDKLAVWTGTHYHVIDDRLEDFTGWFITTWMRLARVDIKKQTARNANEIIENLHMRSVGLNSIHHYQKDKRVVNFQNGTLFISHKGKRKFIPHHDKKHGVMNMLEFNYSENATCPKWDKFLDRVLPNKDDQATLMEFMGYCFLPNHNYEAFLFLYGKSGANGKSVILDVIRSFFGEDNISSLNIQNFVGHQLQGLANKLVNIGSELDAKGLNDGQMGVLKALTSTNDAIQLDPKHVQGYPLASRHQPKLINSGNAKPSPKVMDDGVYRRMLLLNFDSEIKDDEKIRDLASKFDGELDGIMARALKGLDELVKRGTFTKSDRLNEAVEEYKDQTNPVRAYAKEALVKDSEVIIPKKLLYSHYKAWMEEKGFYVVTEPKFFQLLGEQFPKMTTRKQLRIPPTETTLSTALGMDRINFVKGLYCISADVQEFLHGKHKFTTASINRSDDQNKSPVLKEEHQKAIEKLAEGVE